MSVIRLKKKWRKKPSGVAKLNHAHGEILFASHLEGQSCRDIANKKSNKSIGSATTFGFRGERVAIFDGSANSSINFDTSVNDYLKNLGKSGYPVTVLARAYVPNSTVQTGYIMFKSTGLFIRTGGTSTTLEGGVWGTTNTSISNAITAGKFHNIAFTFNGESGAGEEHSLFLNGLKGSTVTGGTSSATTNTNDIEVGNRSTDTDFQGEIEYVYIIKGVLSDSLLSHVTTNNVNFYSTFLKPRTQALVLGSEAAPTTAWVNNLYYKTLLQSGSI